jgi:hypothetical protein
MTLREERELAQSAQGILEKQRQRCYDAAGALRQWISFIRARDLRPEDREALAFCDRYLESRRKSVSREEGESITFEERAG